jgi:nucleosome binding factor SPN SPT16 subunit
MWPMISGRKTEGVLEAHANGFRFISSKGEKVDLIYGNVKHAIFQPCEGEHVVLVHFHLKVRVSGTPLCMRPLLFVGCFVLCSRCVCSCLFLPLSQAFLCYVVQLPQKPILVGKKKCKDIQFYTEVRI